MPESKLKSGWLKDAVAPKIFSNTSDDNIKNILGNSAENTSGWNLTSWLSRNPLSLTGQIAPVFGEGVARNIETGIGNTVGGLLTTVGELGVGVSKSFQDDWKPDHCGIKRSAYLYTRQKKFVI